MRPPAAAAQISSALEVGPARRFLEVETSKPLQSTKGFDFSDDNNIISDSDGDGNSHSRRSCKSSRLSLSNSICALTICRCCSISSSRSA